MNAIDAVWRHFRDIGHFTLRLAPLHVDAGATPDLSFATRKTTSRSTHIQIDTDKKHRAPTASLVVQFALTPVS
ncbi:hypothetical protein FRC08_002741, partial [Ceratobasidium sp. 394]